MYEGRRFLAGGFRQHELYFPDGSCPSEAILQRFLAIVEAEPGARSGPSGRRESCCRMARVAVLISMTAPSAWTPRMASHAQCVC